jgi:hypothetical protein
MIRLNFEQGKGGGESRLKKTQQWCTGLDLTISLSSTFETSHDFISKFH